MTATAPVLVASELRKSYGHVKALRGASLSVRPGEVVAIVGDNGAGKSTFISCICGALTPDAGNVTIDGTPLEPGSIASAMSAGLAAVYQDLAVAPHLSVVENIFLSTEIRSGGPLGRLGVLDRRTMRREAEQLMHSLGIDLPNLDRPVEQLSGGQRQVVAVARAVSRASRVIVLDEPTAALGAKQSQIVLDTITATRRRGIAVLLISHDLPRVLEVADRIVVMRLGSVASEIDPSGTTVSDVVAAMLGENRENGEDRRTP
ncbi:ATP-binding cassette domain-containing protein [Jiangella sp. DSM 45060]|uniref:ATP-binding cassette domain-containing protein n=1 Tax=Jiangella sp. DSM 45060 TaxID=1798224 RepID=UPI000879F604|nr:ATP-binding cassette domain-containing protein [Jiangella sp. DSM 45060]SDS44521.1 simple sugar transport system ATP-binding protein [Jiangella sp. DSM 45060]